MLEFCDRNKGAISVFLIMILLPVMLLGGLTVDAARIYASRSVVSDAGDLTMNAALAQYEKELHDEYGLLVMQKDPESMEKQLEKLFNRSLNGSGLADSEEYDKILDLVTEQFDAINLAGSEIYRTEVEKQQIVEYMKYRAPVCLTELLVEKLKVLQETKKMADAMVAQMDFAESMEDCQSSMKIALDALKLLDIDNQNFPSRDSIQSILDSAQREFQSKLSKYMLRLAAIPKFKEVASGELKDLAKSCISAAGNISLGENLEYCFEDYLEAIYYQQGFENAGGVSKLKAEIGNPPSEDKNSEEYIQWNNNKKAIEDLIVEYQSAKEKISTYPGKLRSAAKEIITHYHDLLREYYDLAERGAEEAETANNLLEIVKKDLEKAKKAWEDWEQKTGELSEPGEMPAEVAKYREFFGSSGSAAVDGNDLENLMNKVSKDKQYYTAVMSKLIKEKFYEKSLVLADVNSQYSTYYSKASQCMGEVTLNLDIDSYLDDYRMGYQHVVLSEINIEQITFDPFYLRLQKYCDAENREESKTGKEQANVEIKKAEDASGKVKDSELSSDFKDYQWKMTANMPSVLLGFVEAESANDKMTDVGGDANNSKNRKKAVGKFRDSISETSGFLSKLDEQVTKNLQNLYMAEYAMQMLSYYTSNVKDGEKLNEEQVIGMSGYKLKEHKAYLAEVEYVLWGNPSSRVNVNYTMMTVFGIRMLFNSFFAFTNNDLITRAQAIAVAVSGPAPYLEPIIKALVLLGYAGWETGLDMSKIKEGYGVTILKTKDSWAAPLLSITGGDNTMEANMDYSEFLRLFLNINMLSGNAEKKLARIGDCIAVNTGYDMSKGYTMLALETKVKIKTTFMRQISEMGSDTYLIRYQSILGY